MNKSRSSQSILAAIDLGSNSFRMMVGRVDETPLGSQVFQIDALREPVRLAAGLAPDKHLDSAAFGRGLDALKRFGQRLRGFSADSVRAVATNTLRIARNAPEFLAAAEGALGFPIEVIAGREEARLIYIGASHDAPPCDGNRLVVDIGGGSTEFIIGAGYRPEMMESLFIGCVSHSRQFFADGVVDDEAMKQAILAARSEIQILAKPYRNAGWTQAIGSSGTARALAELIEENGLDPDGGAHRITYRGLDRLKRALLHANHVHRVRLEGLKPDRIPVLPGGLSIMLAVFEELRIESMEVTDGALRLGVLYDLLGRSHHEDVRTLTIDQFMRRYNVDQQQARRVAEIALAVLNQFDAPRHEARDDNLALLHWAACLHEAGLSIAHSGYHRHSAYIATHADMPGFSKTDQARLAALVLGHTGKLGKLQAGAKFMDWRMLFSLRLACLLRRSRSDETIPPLQVAEHDNGYSVRVPAAWLAEQPLTEFGLKAEAAQWQRIGLRYELILV